MRSLLKRSPPLQIARFRRALNAISNGEDPTLLILPADHQIIDNKEFLKSILLAEKFVNDEKIMTFGVKPNNSSTGYGYIKTKNK